MTFFETGRGVDNRVITCLWEATGDKKVQLTLIGFLVGGDLKGDVNDNDASSDIFRGDI